VWADQQTLLAQYRQALGMIADLPLGEAAMDAVSRGLTAPSEGTPERARHHSAEEDIAAQRAANIAATEASRDARNKANGEGVEKPKPFAEQPIHQPAVSRPRGRRKPVLFDQEHPQGTA
jgi:hypothetical protein